MNPSPAAPAGPVTPFPMKRKIAAILAADVAGYSRLVAENEERTLTELAETRQIFDALIARVGGRIFNTAGDSVMVEFDSAVEALRAAVDIQDAMKSRNANVEARQRFEFRMGLTIGDVVERDGDLLGDGVNIAARLESLAPPGGICVSRSVHEAVSNKLAVSFRELGPRQVKNIPQPVFAYVIEPANAAGGIAMRAEPLVARRSAGDFERPRRLSEAREGRRRRGFFGGLARSLVITAVVLTIVFLAVPALRLAQTSIESWQPDRPTSGPQTAERPPTAPQTAEKPPANESGTPSTPPPQDKPGPTDKPTAGTAPPPTSRPQRVERPRTPPKTEPTKPEPQKEAAKPEPSKDPPRPEAGRPGRPSDPAAAYVAMAREGLIADAKTLAEHYHNARFLEGKNDRNGALAAYAQAAPLAGEYIDVHFRHASLLRALRGAGAVRQAYAALVKTSPSLAGEIVLALSSEGDERRAKLEALATANPNTPIIDHLLADALLDGGPTLTDRRLAFDLGERFLEAASSGELNGRFVDRAFLDGWTEGARRRRGDIERFFSSGRTRPSVAFSRIPSGWNATLTLPEPASAVSIRIGERGAFTSTGFTSTPDEKTGKPLPHLEFELPNGTPRVTLYLTYRDRSGREAGPFPLAFDPGAATVDAGRAALERFPDSWVTFRDDLPDVLSFAGLVSNRCAVSKANIGFGDEPPRRPLPLPPCDTTGPSTLPSNASLISIPNGTDSVQVQLVFADGSESPVRTFKRP